MFKSIITALVVTLSLTSTAKANIAELLLGAIVLGAITEETKPRDVFTAIPGSDRGFNNIQGKWTYGSAVTRMVLKDGTNIVTLNGSISKYNVDQVISAVAYSNDRNKYATRVYLNSNGGNAAEGQRLGRAFRSLQVEAIIANEQDCASACADAFIGGKFRKMTGNGSLWVHAAYYKNSNGSITCVKTGSRDHKIEMAYYMEMLPASSARGWSNAVQSRCSTTNLLQIDKNTTWLLK